jgi:hypothetical protein
VLDFHHERRASCVQLAEVRRVTVFLNRRAMPQVGVGYDELRTTRKVALT